MVTVWRLMTHHKEREFAEKLSRTKKRIAVGWGDLGDLRKLPDVHGPTDLGRHIRKEYGDRLKNSGDGGHSLWNLLHEMDNDDLVILSTGKKRCHVMQVKDGYDFAPDEDPRLGNYWHIRKAISTNHDPNEIWARAGSATAKGQSIRWTLVRCARRARL